MSCFFKAITCLLGVLTVIFCETTNDDEYIFNADIVNTATRDSRELGDTIINIVKFKNQTVTDHICVINDKEEDCKNRRIIATNITEWSEKLKSDPDFLVVTSERPATNQDFERGLLYHSFVLRMSNDDYENFILPYSSYDVNFTLTCVRIRNCDVIGRPFFLYPVSIAIYVAVIVAWVRWAGQTQGELKTPQKILTAFLCLKCFCDVALLYHILLCQPEGELEGLNYILTDLRNLVRPIFEGLLIYFLLSLSMGKWIYREEPSKCEVALVNMFAFAGGFTFAMFYTFNTGGSIAISQQIHASVLSICLIIGIVSGIRSLNTLESLRRLNISEEMNNQFTTKSYYIYGAIALLCISFSTQSAAYFTINIVGIKDRTSVMLFGYEAIMKSVILGALALMLNPKYFTREYLLAQLGGLENIEENELPPFRTITINANNLAAQCDFSKHRELGKIFTLSPFDASIGASQWDIIARLQYAVRIKQVIKS